MRRTVLALVVLAALGVAPAASAEVVTSLDRAGRTISFDVRAEGVDVEWYAELLRGTAHGDEIERVTFTIVSKADLSRVCGQGAGGCYRRGGDARIALPADTSAENVHTLIHEYGHHVDAWRGVATTSREPNGSASWWEARGMAKLLAEGRVSHTYSLGWERSIGEIFAEDYTQLHLETPFRIGWLASPAAAVRAALRRDLENVPAAPAPAAPRPPVIVNRVGTLRTSTPVTIPFELLGPGRRATFTATIARADARVRMELRCSDGRRASRTVGGARRSHSIDLRNLGPARCTVTLRRTGKAAVTYSARLRLAIERPGV